MRHPTIFSVCLFLASCGSAESGQPAGPDNFDPESAPDDPAATGGACELGAVDDGCDQTRTPILFVHGGFGGGDNFELQAQRFTSNGYCRDWVAAFDWDSVTYALPGAENTNDPTLIASLDAAVNALREKTGFEQIDLVGHSMGGSLSPNYMGDLTRAAKIAHYVHVAGAGLPPAHVPSLGIASSGDKIVGTPNWPTSENPPMPYLDHVAIATAAEPFAAMYEFLNGEPPATTDVTASGCIEVSGFMKNFADNEPRADATIEVFALDGATGERRGAEPDATLTTDVTGAWGPFLAEPGVPYEFFMPDAGEDGRPLHMYRAPFVRSTHLMYIKAMPRPGSIPAALLSGLIAYDDSRMGLIVQHNHRAIIYGNDRLSVDGIDVATPETTAEANTTIALFLGDENANGETDLTPVSRFSVVPFLKGVDIFVPTREPGPVGVTLNDVTLNVPRLRSATDGIALVLLDG